MDASLNVNAKQQVSSSASCPSSLLPDSHLSPTTKTTSTTSLMPRPLNDETAEAVNKNNNSDNDEIFKTQLIAALKTKMSRKPLISIRDVVAQAKALENATVTTSSSAALAVSQSSPRSARVYNNPNDRLKSKLAKKNWQTVMNVAVVKEANRFENIYATNTENWTFVSIIIAVVTFLSILICH